MKSLLSSAMTFALCVTLASSACADPEKGPQRQGDRKGPGPGEMLKKLDADNDGKISKAEFAKSPIYQKNPQRAATLFQRLDQNNDGFLTPKEFAAAKGEKPGQQGPRKPGQKPDRKPNQN